MNDMLMVHFEKANRHKSLKCKRGGGRGLYLLRTARGRTEEKRSEAYSVSGAYLQHGQNIKFILLLFPEM